MTQIATCIGCGCNDLEACCGDAGPCSWLVVDRALQLGVCSSCDDQLVRWYAGDRELRLVVAKITRDGAAAAQPYYLERSMLGALPSSVSAKVGERLVIEWERMAVSAFESLPQFEHVRLVAHWMVETSAAEAALARDGAAAADAHQVAADRIASIVYEMTGCAVQDFLPLDERDEDIDTHLVITPERRIATLEEIVEVVG